MTVLFASGHVVDIVLAVMLLEAGLLLAYRHRTRHGPSAAELLSVLVPGVFLLLALRAALVGAGALLISACLLAALLAHVADIARRWRSYSITSRWPIPERQL
jgi:NhaP-type Na+/H+ or K+/H+ antiporter